jgi:hypothetical protein
MKPTISTMLALSAMAVTQVAAADISGTWKMNIEILGGTSSPSFMLAQKDESISGTYKGQFGEAPVTGTLSGNDVVFSYNAVVQGVPMEVRYTGTVNGNTMSGRLFFVGIAEGTFKGERQ